MTDRELMKWALYALEGSNAYDWPVVEELKERLEQPEQEPVAWANESDLPNFDMKVRTCPDLNHTVPLYTAPPKKEWVGLTDDEIMEPWPFENRISFARWVESKVLEKNT